MTEPTTQSQEHAINTDPGEGYGRNGYAVVRGIFDPDRVARLLPICERVLAQWRERPLSDNPPVGPLANYLRHLNNPGYHRGRPEDLAAILDAAAAPAVLSAVDQALGEPHLFTGTSLYFNPTGEPLDGFWHKDAIGPEADDQRDHITGSGLQVQVALVPSEDLAVVPGSHLREFTDAERHICVDDDGANRRSNDMPGAVRIPLQPGDAVLFNQIVIHRGRYYREPPRLTFMTSFRKRRVTEATLARRGLDQYSDQPWFLAPDYLNGTAPETRRYFSDYTAFYAPQWRGRLAETLKYHHLIQHLHDTGSPYPFAPSESADPAE